MAAALGFMVHVGCNADAVAALLAQNNGAFPVSKADEGHAHLTSKAEFDGFFYAFLSYQTDPTQPLHQGRVLRAQVTAAATQEELDAVVDDR